MGLRWVRVVLWHHMITNSPAAPTGGAWTPKSGSLRANCENDATAFNKTWFAGSSKDRGGYEYINEYGCVPDTMNPRRPKGK